MRIARIACVAVVAGAAALATSPVASAAYGGGAAHITVSPPVTHHRAAVAVRVDCSAYGKPHPTKVASHAFTSKVRLKPQHGRPGHFWGVGKVRTTIAPGYYRVGGNCLAASPKRSSEFVTTLKVVGHRTGSSHATGRGAVAARGAANTGDGATQLAAATTPNVVEGGALTAGGLGFGLMALRRRRSGARG